MTLVRRAAGEPVLVNFLMTAPTPVVTYDPDADEYTASRDEIRVAAVGKTEHEAVMAFGQAYFQWFAEEQRKQWTTWQVTR